MNNPLKEGAAYQQMWRAIHGGIKDFRAAHPEELASLSEGREASLVKRIAGQLVSMAERWSGQGHNPPAEKP